MAEHVPEMYLLPLQSFANDVDMEDLGLSTYQSLSQLPEPSLPGHANSGDSNSAQPQVPAAQVSTQWQQLKVARGAWKGVSTHSGNSSPKLPEVPV